MPKLRLANQILIIPTLLVLPACDAGRPPREARPDAEIQAFSDAEKAAAKTLSIGDNQTLETMSDPMAKALACNRSIGSLIETLRGSDALTDLQWDAIKEARDFYGQQVPVDRTGGTSDGNAEYPTDNPQEIEIGPANDARLALACLRALEGQL